MGVGNGNLNAIHILCHCPQNSLISHTNTYLPTTRVSHFYFNTVRTLGPSITCFIKCIRVTGYCTHCNYRSNSRFVIYMSYRVIDMELQLVNNGFYCPRFSKQK